MVSLHSSILLPRQGQTIKIKGWSGAGREVISNKGCKAECIIITINRGIQSRSLEHFDTSESHEN